MGGTASVLVKDDVDEKNLTYDYISKVCGDKNVSIDAFNYLKREDSNYISKDQLKMIIQERENAHNCSDNNLIRLINFDIFREMKEFPRCPNNEGQTVSLDSINMSESFIVFISHCWLRGHKEAEGFDGSPHPDNARHEKIELCISGIQKLLEFSTELTACYVWLDYGCINQDGNPAGELKQLDKIIEASDCIFTPIVDHTQWELIASPKGYLDAYKAPAWHMEGGQHGYLDRGWCRVEMFYSANIPTVIDKHDKFHHGLRIASKRRQRPHFLYGTREAKLKWRPILMEPLQNSYFSEYDPTKGFVSVEGDRCKIRELVDALLPYMKMVTYQYEGEMKDGVKHGQGKACYPNGDVYVGEFRNDLQWGEGVYTYANCDYYKGAFENDKRHGYGVHYYATGDVYVGNWKDDLKDGEGMVTYTTGDMFEGTYVQETKQGPGKYIHTNGEVFEGIYVDGLAHGPGRYCYPDGLVYEGTWENDFREGRGVYRKEGCPSVEGHCRHDVFTSDTPEEELEDVMAELRLSAKHRPDKHTHSWSRKITTHPNVLSDITATAFQPRRPR